MLDHPMVPYAFNLATEENLSIEKLVYGGEGLARADRKVVLTPYVLPEERVRVESVRLKNDVWRGRLLEVLEPSAHRVNAPCPYFYRCGGCHYQHADYGFQVEQKISVLREVLRRGAKIEF